MTNPFQILLIGGSTRNPSYTRTLTEEVERRLAPSGAVTTHWDLRDRPLPIADPDFHADPSRHPDERVRSLVALAGSCDAFVLASPVYHNSYSGVLKNALDHLAIAQFQYKPVGLISHGGNRSTQPVDHLRIVVRGLLGVATPSQVCTAKQDYRDLGTEGYALESPEILVRIERFTRELIAFAYQLRSLRRTLLQI
jgi:azobenzene reductase